MDRRSLLLANSIVEAVGRTPVVKLAAYSNAVGCEVFAKLENLNPGGSHKVRIALAMVLDAERRGLLRRHSGQTLLEPSGGNTGIGLAIAGALFGYRVILVIPDNYSKEKRTILRLYGAKIILSDSKTGNNSHGMKAMEIQLAHPEYVMLNQQRNPANPEIHRTTTAQELLDVFAEQPIDYFVAGIGTGGHITGIGERLKREWLSLGVIGVEPDGCDLLNNRHSHHEIQGLSVGIVPDVLNVSVIDRMIQVTKKECVDMVSTIMSGDAINLGISSAGNFVAIGKLAGSVIPSGSRVLTIIYDGIDQYLGYFDRHAHVEHGDADADLAQ